MDEELSLFLLSSAFWVDEHLKVKTFYFKGRDSVAKTLTILSEQFKKEKKNFKTLDMLQWLSC